MTGLALCMAAAGAGASQASAAVTIGETFAPTGSCSPQNSNFTSASPPPGPSHAAPTNGVITSWSFQAAGDVPLWMRFKTARGTPTTLTTVGRGPAELIAANTLNTFPVRIPVQAGDVIGFFVPAGSPLFNCARISLSYTLSFVASDPALGSTDAYATDGAELDLSAQLEPDADNDGFGDETQDRCPTDVDTVNACRDKTPPETTITRKPKKKNLKKKATFEFTSPEAGVTFRCSLNGAAFAPCTSPRPVNAKKRRNVFTVFARDAAGNIDETPATYSWTYKKAKTP